MKFEPAQPSLSFGVITTIIAYLFFALASATVRIFDPSFPTSQILFMQNLICLLAVLPQFFHQKHQNNFNLRLFFFHLVRDIAGYLSYFCFFYAIQILNLLDATLLSYTAPFYTPFIVKVWTKGKIEKEVWWSILLGFIGIVLILQPSEIFTIGALLGLLSGFFSSLALVSVRVLNEQQESLWRTLFLYFLIGTIFSSFFAFKEWHPLSFTHLMALIWIGIATIIGQILLTIAYKHGTASFLSPISYVSVIFAGIFSWAFFSQPPGWLSFIGALFVIIGGTITYIIRTKPQNIIQMLKHHESHFYFLRKFFKKNTNDDVE